TRPPIPPLFPYTTLFRSMLFLQRALVLAVALSLGACATQTQTRVTDAAATPLSDLHIVKSEIPSVLVAASKGPYALPDDRHCERSEEHTSELQSRENIVC